jgi:hypothetical protein
MSPAPGLLTVAFGDLDAGMWGAVWGSGRPFAAVGMVGADVLPIAALLDGGDEGGEWRIEGDDCELVVAPDGEAAPVLPADPALAGFDQLCRVRGRFRAPDGSDRELECPGRRGSRAGPLDPKRFESLRDVSAWFGEHDGLALVAARPRKAPGHGSDLVTATIFAPAGNTRVADPRLSTTYSADGRPARVGLELWIDDEEAGDEQFPRRAAGEVIGGGVRSRAGEGGAKREPQLMVEVELLRCHSRGREGAGVYLLARVA